MDHPSSHPISVIVPHYNDLAGLDRCLASLASQTLSRSDYEVIVVDNMSSLDRHELERVVSSRGRLLFENDQGAGPTRNRGVAGSSGKFLAFIDSDCVADRLWLERGIAALKDFDFVGGRVDVLVTDPAAPTPVESFEQVFAFDFERYIRVKGLPARAIYSADGPFSTASGPFRMACRKTWSGRIAQRHWASAWDIATPRSSATLHEPHGRTCVRNGIASIARPTA